MTHGTHPIDGVELGERIAAFDASAVRDGRISLIDKAGSADALVAALATREAGGVPLVVDKRWPAEYRSALEALVAASEPDPGIGWATSTSGTSGAPRVILRSHRSWSTSFPAVAELLALTAADVVYLPAPISASMSLFSAAHARAVGGGVLLSTASAAEALDRSTVMHGTPYALATILDAIDDRERHRLRAALVGGAPLDAALRARAEAHGIRVVSYYGAAELSFAAVDTDGLGLRAFPGVELRHEGDELWVRSGYVASGYLGASTGSLRRDADGWATVGDFVSDGDAAALHLLGRRDGAILTAAATVIPEEVEAALRTIAGVRDAVVFAVPNAGVGSLVGVVIETAGGPDRPSVIDVRQSARGIVAPSHLPRRWFSTERLDRTASGKPARARIRADALEGRIERYE